MEDSLQRLIFDKFRNKDLHLFKTSHEKALAGTYTYHYKAVDQASTKGGFFRGADNLVNRRIGKLADSV